MPNLLDRMTKDEADQLRYFLRLGIATYLLGQMMNTDAHSKNGETAKERKVKAAFEYADLLMKG